MQSRFAVGRPGRSLDATRIQHNFPDSAAERLLDECSLARKLTLRTCVTGAHTEDQTMWVLCPVQY